MILRVEVDSELVVGVAVLSLSCVNRELFSRSVLAGIDSSVEPGNALEEPESYECT